MAGDEVVLYAMKIQSNWNNPVHTFSVTLSNGEVKQGEIRFNLLNELQAEYDTQDYARKREGEYPKIGDQLDKIYHEGIDAWKADIKAIKDKYPKPS